MTRVAVVEPYLGGSHQAWADGFAERSKLDVSVFGLPSVHWKWRMQGGHVTLAEQLSAATAADGPFDAIVASDMANLAALAGLLRDVPGDPVLALYMHENQLTFPREEHDAEDLTYATINWTSMLAADVVVFNSAFHRDEWFGALPTFLGRMPDRRHGHLVDAVREKTVVLPVGVSLAVFDSIPAVRGERPLAVWNQRWQWDKGSDLLVEAAEAWVSAGVDVDLAVVGDRGTDRAGLDRIVELLGDRLIANGRLERGDYERLLRSADVVLSTARHEFFGVAVVEAIHAGAMPIVPDGLVYPEYVPDDVAARCRYRDTSQLVDRLAWAAAHRDDAGHIAERLRTETARFDWTEVAPRYDACVLGAIDRRRTSPMRGDG